MWGKELRPEVTRGRPDHFFLGINGEFHLPNADTLFPAWHSNVPGKREAESRRLVSGQRQRNTESQLSGLIARPVFRSVPSGSVSTVRLSALITAARWPPSPTVLLQMLQTETSACIHALCHLRERSCERGEGRGEQTCDEMQSCSRWFKHLGQLPFKSTILMAGMFSPSGQ